MLLQYVLTILRDDPNLDLNARDSGGNTALHYAVRRGQVEIVEALLKQASHQGQYHQQKRAHPRAVGAADKAAGHGPADRGTPDRQTPAMECRDTRKTGDDMGPAQTARLKRLANFSAKVQACQA